MKRKSPGSLTPSLAKIPSRFSEPDRLGYSLMLTMVCFTVIVFTKPRSPSWSCSTVQLGAREQDCEAKPPTGSNPALHWQTVLPWASCLIPLVHGKCYKEVCYFSHPECGTPNGTDNRTMHTLGAQLLLLVREHSTQIAFPSMNVWLLNTSNLLACQGRCLWESTLLSSNGKGKKCPETNEQNPPPSSNVKLKVLPFQSCTWYGLCILKKYYYRKYEKHLSGWKM